jgi:hypothetical protein
MSSSVIVPTPNQLGNSPNAIQAQLITLAGACLIDMSRDARVAIGSALPSYAASGGVLTASANGALASQDGVALAVGDRVLLAAGAAGADNGLYTVTSLGSAGSKWVLTRATDSATASTTAIKSGTEVLIQEGTTYRGTTWKLDTTGTVTVDTTSQTWYPKTLRGTVTLSGGVFTLSNQWVRTNATCMATDTTAAAATKTTVTAGAGTGSVAFTGTTTDVLAYHLDNLDNF